MYKKTVRPDRHLTKKTVECIKEFGALTITSLKNYLYPNYGLNTTSVSNQPHEIPELFVDDDDDDIIKDH